MIVRPTTDECVRLGLRGELSRAYGRRGIPGRGPGGRRAGGGGGTDPLLSLFGVGETDGLYIDWTSVDLVGADVDVAYDLSPHGRTFTSVTRPSYSASSANFGGRPTATFTAATVEYMAAATSAVLDAAGDISWDCVFLVKGTATGGTNGRVLDKRVQDGLTAGFSSTTGINMIRDSTLGAGTASITFVTAGTTRSSVTLDRSLYDPTVAGGTYYARINGTAGTGVTTGQGGTCTNANIAAIGARNGGVTPLDAEVALILARVGGGIFSAAERALIVSTINSRYGTSFTDV